MFTGIIEDIGKVVRVSSQGNAARLEISTSLPPGEIAIGDSISVNGACQTVEEFHAPVLSSIACGKRCRKRICGN